MNTQNLLTRMACLTVAIGAMGAAVPLSVDAADHRINKSGEQKSTKHHKRSKHRTIHRAFVFPGSITRYDTNGDSRVTRREFATPFLLAFDGFGKTHLTAKNHRDFGRYLHIELQFLADTDRDGYLSRDELYRANHGANKRIVRKRVRRHVQAGEVFNKARKADKHVKRADKHILRRFDKDEDGKVNKDEYSDGVFGIFAKMDANGDGVLTKDDMKAHKRQKKSRRRSN